MLVFFYYAIVRNFFRSFPAHFAHLINRVVELKNKYIVEIIILLYFLTLLLSTVIYYEIFNNDSLILYFIKLNRLICPLIISILLVNKLKCFYWHKSMRIIAISLIYIVINITIPIKYGFYDSFLNRINFLQITEDMLILMCIASTLLVAYLLYIKKVLFYKLRYK